MNGEPLYWRDEQGGKMTIVREYENDEGETVQRDPVYVVDYKEMVLGSWGFQPIVAPNGETYQTPVLTFGQGDPSGRGKGRIYKHATGLRLEYDHPNGELYYLELGDEGFRTYPGLGMEGFVSEEDYRAILSEDGKTVVSLDSEQIRLERSGDIYPYPAQTAVYMRENSLIMKVWKQGENAPSTIEMDGDRINIVAKEVYINGTRIDI